MNYSKFNNNYFFRKIDIGTFIAFFYSVQYLIYWILKPIYYFFRHTLS